MKRVIILLILSLFSICSFAQEHLKIKGVPIDGKVSTMVAKLKATGLTTHPDSKPSLPMLKGSFAGLSDCAFGFQTDDDNNVIRVIVVSDDYPSWFSLKNRWEDLKEVYMEKYPDNKIYEFFIDPYEDGDGYELQAIRLEKGFYRAFFFAPEGTISISIKANGSDGYFSIVYEDAINIEKYTAERDKSIKDEI